MHENYKRHGEKVPIETIPVELRIKVYEYGEVSTISTRNKTPWARTILMSGILNDKDAIEIAAIQGEAQRKIMCNYIAYSGNITMMKWARSNKSSKRDEATLMIRSMKQIRLTPFPWDEVSCSNAAKFGHFKLLQWLHEQGCLWDYSTFSSAARFGKIDMLEWLYHKECPWSSWTFSYGAESGNLNVLKWLHERNCPWDSETFSVAIRTGNIDMVEWLHAQKCPWNDNMILGDAVKTGNLTMAKWLVEHGYGLINN
jgi:hypothetical protein